MVLFVARHVVHEVISWTEGGRTLKSDGSEVINCLHAMTLEDNVPLYEKNNVIEEIPDIGVGRVD